MAGLDPPSSFLQKMELLPWMAASEGGHDNNFDALYEVIPPSLSLDLWNPGVGA